MIRLHHVLGDGAADLPRRWHSSPPPSSTRPPRFNRVVAPSPGFTRDQARPSNSTGLVVSGDGVGAGSPCRRRRDAADLVQLQLPENRGGEQKGA